MKKSLFILLCLSMSYSLMAQETTKQKEVGIVFNSLNSFGLTYKFGTNQSLWRINSLFASGSSREESSSVELEKYSNARYGFKFGKEFRTNITEKLEMRYGADLSFVYMKSKRDYEDLEDADDDRFLDRTTYDSGVNLVFGFNYLISESIVLGAEILPYFTYTTGEMSEVDYYSEGERVVSDISGINYGLSSTSALLSLAYRF